MSNKSETLLIVDCHAIIHRAFHAYPLHLSTAEGMPVNAIYGFTGLFLQILEKFKPDYLAFTLDSKGKTFRHKLYQDYKANRPEPDPLLVKQLEFFPEYLSKFGLPVLSKSGYEADDLIGTLVEKVNGERDLEKIVVTGDKDLFQLLVYPHTNIYLAGRNFSQSKLYDRDKASEKMGFGIEYLVDYKGLRGDPSDNIPGIKGIGDKSAVKLIKEYGGITEVYQHLDEVEARYRNKLKDNRDLAEMSAELAEIITDVDLEFDLDTAKMKRFNPEKIESEFRKLEFFSLLNKLPERKVNNNNSQTSFSFNNSNKNVDNATPSHDEASTINEQMITSINNLEQNNCLVVLKGDQQSDTELMLIINIDRKEAYLCPSDDIKTHAKNLNRFFKQNKVFSFQSKRFYEIFAEYADLRDVVLSDLEVIGFVYDYALPQKNLEALLAKRTGFFSDDFEKSFRTEAFVEAIKQLVDYYMEIEENDIPIKSGWSMSQLLTEIELPLLPILSQMERCGIKLDQKKLLKIKQELEEELADYEERIYQLAGSNFNIASPKQLGEILFDKLQLPGAKKTKSGSYSTSERNLKDLRYDFEIVDLVLHYREVSKLISTYTHTLIAEVDKRTGRIHSTFSQTVAATGRLASSEPNLQNIPISSALGRKIRSTFIPEPGKSFIFFDYSQQELRLLAEFSGEKKLIDAFSGNLDIHALTAAELLDKDIEQVSKSERRMGKTVNFGIIYGISAFGLADRLKIDTALAQQYIDNFYNSYPQVRKYFDKLLEKSYRQGYVNSYFGRRRDASGLHAGNYQLRKAAEREIINFPLQGSAADMLKLAMVRLQHPVAENFSEFAQLILQIHDELVYEVATTDKNNQRLREFAKLVKEKMQHVLELSVPMHVDVEFAANLAETEPFIF